LRVDNERGLEVRGDRAALGQVVSNLLINAWKHGRGEPRRISVRSRSIGRDEIEIAVQDNGPGMSNAELRRVFDPFERGRGAIARRTEGVGLGLAIVRAIVRAHDGRVEASSTPGQGAEFRVILPRSPA